jgi:hypothetical protein
LIFMLYIGAQGDETLDEWVNLINGTCIWCFSRPEISVLRMYRLIDCRTKADKVWGTAEDIEVMCLSENKGARLGQI